MVDGTGLGPAGPVEVDADIRVDEVIEGVKYALVVITRHRDGVMAVTAVHGRDFPRRIGGARFVVETSEDDPTGLREVGHLAAAMTEKCVAARLPADGQKSVIKCPGGIPATQGERAEILKEHYSAVARKDPHVTFGPDIQNPDTCQDLVADDPELLDCVTGVTERHGGLSIDENAYTAAGLAHAIKVLVRRGELKAGPVTVQGFGAVGANTALLLAGQGFSVQAVNNIGGTLIARPGQSLNVPTLTHMWREAGDKALMQYADSHGQECVFVDDPDRLLDVPCTVFVPAARTMVLAAPEEMAEARKENPHVRDVVTFHQRTGVRCVLQGANHPLGEGAEAYLEAWGVHVLPDVIVNCGGLVGCVVEWVYRSELIRSAEVRGRFDEACKRYIEHVIEINVDALLGEPCGARCGVRNIVERNRRRALEAVEAAKAGRGRDDRTLTRAALESLGFEPPAV